MALVEYVKDHPDETGWTHYSCYVQILSNSANYKTAIVNLYLMYTHVQNAKKGDPFARIWIVLVVMILSLYLPIICTHTFPGICYGWITMGSMCLSMCLLRCIISCTTACPALKTPLSCLVLGQVGEAVDQIEEVNKEIQKEIQKKLEKMEEGVKDEEAGTGSNAKDEAETKAEDGTGGDEEVALSFEAADVASLSENMNSSPLLLAVTIVLFLIVISATNYWLAKRFSYMGSLERVWTERSVDVYVSHITDQFSTSFRFAATIL